MKSRYISTCILAAVTSQVSAIPHGSPLLERSDRGFTPDLAISGGTLTSKWIEGTDFAQVVEFLVTNNHPSNTLTLADTLNLTIKSDSLTTVKAGTLQRLYPGQTAVAQIGVKNTKSVAAGSNCKATIVATYGQKYGPAQTATQDIQGLCGIPDYKATEDSVNWHWNPEWYNNVKFGIFIHWGVYSAPAYGGVQPVEDYAEWYWYRQHDKNYRTKTYQYHQSTYGENFNYDQFMSNFTAKGFDAKTWVTWSRMQAHNTLCQSRHHDGWSLFNFSTSVSKRSTVHYGPKRDFIGEILAASKKYHPDIRRGTYFSMPEWYNPAYVKYGANLGGNFFGYEPTNPYTGQKIPYTGHVEVQDFIKDIQTPQMEALAYKYETELMWCDIGGANNMTTFASKWLNWAKKNKRQVTFNNRCGIQGDFDTPEYTTNGDTVVRKWETNRGMDPFSFGFNYQTPDSEYLTGADIINTLVDTVSKNGNFLLDIGPKNDGSIPSIMSKGLLDAGAWIKAHGESIFATRFWHTTAGKDNFRYTTKDAAFYIHYLTQPPQTLTIPDPVPWLPGDTVTVIGGAQNGAKVPASKDNNGNLVLTLNDAIIGGDKCVWTFKIAYTSDY